MAHWPADPFELLGVANNSPPKDIQRAYVRLIKRYKPEHYPDQFKRLREAYEHASAISSFRAIQEAASSQETSADESSTGDESDHSEAQDKPPVVDEKPTLEQDLWDLAIQGDEQAAYNRLRELRLAKPDSTNIQARLYWLLMLHPELDPERSPLDYLVEGLGNDPQCWPFLELYRRHLDFDRKEVANARCGRVLHVEMPGHMLLVFLAWRWTAAERMGLEIKAIERDLEVVRERVLMESEQTWVRVLFAAIDVLAWSNDPRAEELFDRLAREAESLDRWPELANDFTRLDHLKVLRAEWRIFLRWQEGKVLPIARLIPLAWRNPYLILRWKLIKLLEPLAADQTRSLRGFDVFFAHCPNLLAQLCGYLDWLTNQESATREDLSDEQLESRIFRHFSRQKREAYVAQRAGWLEFLIRESIHPLLVCQLAANRPEYRLPDETYLSSCIESDVPLLCAWHAHHVFWMGIP
ncbi:MAG: J domain-containing protein [Planctomycetota bacterium]